KSAGRASPQSVPAELGGTLAPPPYGIDFVDGRAGIPDPLRAGIEALSGEDLSGVRVRTNSPEPARLGAHAWTRGAEMHLAPGQEKHLPHEAWHVVQQRQGRVKPTLHEKGAAINDDPALEREADTMGARATSGAATLSSLAFAPGAAAHADTGGAVTQRKLMDSAELKAAGEASSKWFYTKIYRQLTKKVEAYHAEGDGT